MTPFGPADIQRGLEIATEELRGWTDASGKPLDTEQLGRELHALTQAQLTAAASKQPSAEMNAARYSPGKSAKTPRFQGR